MYPKSEPHVSCECVCWGGREGGREAASPTQPQSEGVDHSRGGDKSGEEGGGRSNPPFLSWGSFPFFQAPRGWWGMNSHRASPNARRKWGQDPKISPAISSHLLRKDERGKMPSDWRELQMVLNLQPFF